MSKFQRLANLRRSDTAIQQRKKNKSATVSRDTITDNSFLSHGTICSDFGDSSTIVMPSRRFPEYGIDTSFDSGSDFSGQFDASWHRSSAMQPLGTRPSLPNNPNSGKSSNKLKNLFRGISIKRTKSSAKLDKKKSSREQDGFVRAPHGQFYQPPVAIPPVSTTATPGYNIFANVSGATSNAMTTDQQRYLHERSASQDSSLNGGNGNLKRSLSLGRVARHAGPPTSNNSDLDSAYVQTPSPTLPYALPGYPMIAMTPSGPVPVSRTRPSHQRVTSCLPFPQQDEMNRSVPPPSYNPNNFMSSGEQFVSGGNGSGIRTAQSHESLLTPSGAPLQLGHPGMDVRQLHPSLVPAPGFYMGNTPDRVQRYCLAGSQDDARMWTEQLKKVNRPDLEDTRHKENSLKLWIFEAKNLPAKKKYVYFCEVCINHTLYARTTSKPKIDQVDPFWGEPFEFSNLTDVRLVTIKIYRQSESRKKKSDKLVIGEVHIPSHDILTMCEKWYPAQLLSITTGNKRPSATNPDSCPALRIRARYLSVDVLPLRIYCPLKDFLLTDFLALTRALEPRLPVKMKEELASFMVSVFYKYDVASQFITELVMDELERPENISVTFRGNSIATKAMEAYLKLVGTQYLHLVLNEPVAMIIQSMDSCEVDPQRVASDPDLEMNQRNLRVFVNLFWNRICASAGTFPPELRRLFTSIRQRMRDTERSELCDTVISASLFLRFICPAILGPSLFGLIHELPEPRVTRNLTLIAKAIQNLANFATFGGKESYMTFMNRFISEENKRMKHFLRNISVSSEANRVTQNNVEIDVAFELAQFHMLMTDAYSLLEQGEPGVMSREPVLANLMTLLKNLEYVLTHGEARGDSSMGRMSHCQSTNQKRVYDNTPNDDWVYSNDHSDNERPSRSQSHTHMSVAKPTSAPPKVPAHGMHKSQSLQRSVMNPIDNLASTCVAGIPDNKESVNDEWKRMVSEANASNFNAASAASTTGSSGYQSFPATSPIPAFYNPTYQKSGLPPVQSHSLSSSDDPQSPSPQHDSSSDIISSDEECDDIPKVDIRPPRSTPNPRSSASTNSTSKRISSEKVLLQRPELEPFLSPHTGSDCSPVHSEPEDQDIVEDSSSLDALRGDDTESDLAAVSPGRGFYNTPPQTHSDASSWIFSESMPASRPVNQPPPPPSNKAGGVKMGVRSVQRQRLGKSQQDYEHELANIQMELLETRQKLAETETRLVSNENEKSEMMALFARQLEESQSSMRQQESQKEQQMREIIQRLRFLEADLKRPETNGNNSGLTDSI